MSSLCLSVYGNGTSVYMCSEGEVVERYECVCGCVGVSILTPHL